MKYRLLAPHVLPTSVVLERGTIVGEDTAYPWLDIYGDPIPPSTQMEGLDDEAKEKVRELHQRLYGADPHWDRMEPTEVQQAQQEQADEQQKLDENSEPVSPQQEMERNMMADMPEGAPPIAVPPGPGALPSSTANVAPTTGGEEFPSPGPAKPMEPKAEDIRPSNPNEDQFPKG